MRGRRSASAVVERLSLVLLDRLVLIVSGSLG
jgi:hypothetical protein